MLISKTVKKSAFSALASLIILFSALFGALTSVSSAAELIKYKVTYSATRVMLTLTAQSADNTIYYTTGANKVTTASKVYTKRLSASSMVTVKAIEVNKSGKTVASISIVIKPRVQTVTAELAEYDGYSTLKLSCATVGADIYYTTDGSTPTKKSTVYTGKIKLKSDCTVKAVAYKSNMKASKVTSVNVNIASVEEQAVDYATEVLRLVNAERENVGLAAFTTADSLDKAAQKRADELVTSYSHKRPDGSSCFTALDDYGVSYGYAGENIAWGQTSPEAVVKAWMNSEGHRANILSKNYTQIGIGCTIDNNQFYWSQMFVG